MSQTIYQHISYYLEALKGIAKLVSDRLIDAYAYTQGILYNFFFKISRFANLAWSSFGQSLTTVLKYLSTQVQSLRSIITSIPLPYQAIIGVFTLIGVTFMFILPAIQIIKPWYQKTLSTLKKI